MKAINKLKIFLIIVAASLILFMLAFFYYKSESESIIKEKHEFLSAITNLKLDEVVKWREQRISDARFLPTIGKFIKYTASLKSNKNNSEAEQYFSNALLQFKEKGYYDNVFISDINGEILFSLDKNFLTIEQERFEEIKSALQRNSVVFGEFYIDESNNQLRFNIISIIKDINGYPIGVLVQKVDPNKSLFSLIQKWPTASKTAETLLFKKGKDNIVFLNELRHKKNTALSFNIPLSQKEVVAVKGALGARGIIEGKDYRGADVLADLKIVPGTEWYMVTKVDKEELYSELLYQAGVIAIIVLITILLITFTALYIYKQQQSSIYKNLFLKQKELVETQQEYKTTLYSIGDGVITTDTHGNIRHMNSIAESLTGWKENETKGKKLSEVFNVINEYTDETVENPVEEVLEKGAIVGLANHTILVSKTGNKIPIADSGSPIKNEKNEIIGVVLVFRDQTNERIKEKNLIESSQKYLKIFNTSYDSISLTLLSTGRVVEINKGFEKMFGYSKAEIIGNSTLDLGLWVDPSAREKMITEIKSKGNITNFEAIGRRKNGELLTGIISGEIIKLSGEAYLFLTIREITERKKTEELIKQSEANLNSLINNRNESIWSIDRNYNYIFINDFFRDEFYKTLKIKLFKGINALEILTPEIRSFWKLKYDAALSGEKVEFEYSLEQNNEQKYFQVYLNPIISDGIVTGVSALSFDITQQKLSEKKLFENQIRLQSILSNAPVIIFGLDTNGIFTFSEGKGLAALGLKSGEVVGQSAIELYKDFPSVVESLKRALKGEILTAVHDMGKWVFDVHYTPLKNENNQVIGLIGVATDMTERKRAEDALIKSEERLRLSLSAGKQGLYDLNIQTGDAVVNEEYALMIGYDPDKFKETNSFWIERLHPDDQEVTAKAYSDYIEGKTEEYKVEFRQKTKDNKWKWILSLGKIVEYDQDGKPLRMLGTHTDITELKLAQERIRKSEETYRLTAEQTGEIIYDHDLKTKITKWSGAIEQITGYSPDEFDTIVANDIYKFIHSEDNERIKALCNEATKKGSKYQSEYKFRKKDGNYIYIEDNAAFLKDEKGDVVRMLGTMMDITEKKKLLDELIAAKERAEEMNRVKSYFYANMSHELRTPFVGIMGFAELLSESLQNPTEKEMAAQILKASTRLMETLNKILNVTRLEFDKIDVKLGSVDVVELIKQLSILFSKSASIKNTVIKTDLEPGIIRIKTDGKILEEILTNLLNNAIKYTENGLINISAKLIIKKDKDYLILKVSDNGLGIPKEKQDIVWQEFRQASEGMNRSFEGTGLGLTIIKKYVTTLGGTIKLESEVGEGSAFTIELPVINLGEKEITVLQNKPSVHPKISNVPKSGKPKILYVEDDIIALNYVDKVLRSSYEIDTAFSASIALDLAKKKKYEAVMLDINLGRGIDGIELMQLIRKIEGYSTIPIVAVTAYANESDKLEFLAKGFNYYLSKPFTSIELKASLSRIFN
jgi:PAS domain S-box-containing protein